MIRINLSSLAPSKAKRGGKRAPAAISIPSGGGEGSGTLVWVLIFILVVGVGIYVAETMVAKEKERLTSELKKANEENARLSEVKAKYEASKHKAEMFERRVRVIDDLKEAQKGPVTLLNLVADTVNKTDAVWLDTMTTDGRNLNFTGLALNADAVADLMSNLRKTGAFKSVEIKETAQDAAVKEITAFKFELICEIGISSKIQRQS